MDFPQNYHIIPCSNIYIKSNSFVWITGASLTCHWHRSLCCRATVWSPSIIWHRSPLFNAKNVASILEFLHLFISWNGRALTYRSITCRNLSNRGHHKHAGIYQQEGITNMYLSTVDHAFVHSLLGCMISCLNVAQSPHVNYKWATYLYSVMCWLD